MKIHSSSLIAAFVAVMLMATVSVIIKLNSANEMEIGIVRLAIASLGLSLLMGLKRFKWQLTQKEWLALMALGFIFALHWYTYFKSIKLSTPAISTIAVSTYGIHLMLLSATLLRQTISKFEWLALGFVLLGILLIVPAFNWQSEDTQGFVYGLLSGFLYACLPIIHNKARQLSHTLRAWGQFSFALVLFLPFGVRQPWQLSHTDWLGLIFLGIMATLVAHSLWVKASTELSGVVSSLIYYLYVPTAMLLSFFFVHETISTKMILGAATIIAANSITLFSKLKKQKIE